MPNSDSAIIYYGGFKSTSGGAYMHACLLHDALLDAGWSSKIVTLDILPTWCKYLPHLALKASNFISPTSGFLLKGKIISYLFKIFYSDKLYDLAIFEDVYLAWERDKPSIVVLHAVWSDNLEGMNFSPLDIKNLKSYEARLLQSLKYPVTTVSPEYQDFLQNQHFNGFKLPSLFCTPLGVDLPSIASFSKNPSGKNPYSLVFCGACIERKNLFFLLDVVESLIAINDLFTLTIIGDGPLLNTLQLTSKKRNLPIFFKGRLARKHLLEEFSLCSICVHTSTKESFSLSLLEAKILGLSTVAYGNLEVPAEFIDIPVSTFNVSSWVAAILEALNHNSSPDLRMYSSSRMAEQLVSLAKMA